MENKSVVFREQGKVDIEKVEMPKVEANEVLIETSCTLISTGTELTYLGGGFSKDSMWNKFVNYPFYPGYNNIGRIIEVGSSVDKDFIGRRVATYNGHKQYAVSSLENLRPIPEEVEDKEAVFFTIAEIVMNGIRRGEIMWGESVAVFGLGILGQLAVRIANIAGARPVIGLDIADSRLDYLPEQEGILGVNTKDDNWTEQVKKATKERMMDVVVELTGNSQVIPSEFSILKEMGRFVVISSPKGDKTAFDFHDFCNAPSYTIIGAHNNSHPRVATPQNPWTKKRDAELYFEYVRDGSLEVESLISHKESYENAVDIYKSLLEDRSKAMGVILEW